MKRRNSTRHALLMSIISLMLCLSMLVGTTFAWFTDEVVSGKNQIIAGNLDVELEYSKDMSENSWNPVGGKTDLLDPNARWEPGHTEVVYLRVSNQGTLALKYSFQMSFADTVVGKSVLGNDIYLSKYLKCALLEDVTAKFATRADAREEAEKEAADLVTFTGNGQLEAGAAPKTMALVVYMPESVTNEANYRGTAVPQIDMGLRLFATQMMKESDSFGYTYDEQAAVFTVADANALLQENKDVALVNCKEPESILYVPADYTGTLVLDNVSIASVQQVEPIMTAAEDGTVAVAAEEIKIIILGNVQVKATQEGMSAITATKLNIAGSGTLTAVANGKAAFGIGGMDTTSITMKDLTVAYVEGGEAYGVGSDTKYYKDAPEGGAAIGSGKDGAVITLENVNVLKAIGGSKAAAIGARYHVGVTVNITDSTIDYAEGGVSAAAIGGSRVSNGATESGTIVNITNSTVTAVGGAFGAGIGSGYDTHCQAVQPLCTINISDSDITATGGRYAAGVGTGYHNAALAGEIKNSTVKAVSGEKVYKTTYTAAMDIGFGVTDPTREGQQTDSKLIYNGTEITLDSAPAIAVDNAGLTAAIQEGEKEIVLGAGTYVLPNAAQGKTLTIIGSKDTVIATNTSGSYEGCNYALDGSTVVFENITITTDGKTYTGYARCNATYNNCVINNTYTLYGNSVFNNCTFNVSGDLYNLWTWGAPNATFNNCTFNSDGKAVLLYGTENTNLTLNDCTFNDNGALADKKAAVEIGNDYNKSYTLTVNNTVVNGYEINDKGISTGTTLWGNKNSMTPEKLTVTVDGVVVYGSN